MAFSPWVVWIDRVAEFHLALVASVSIHSRDDNNPARYQPSWLGMYKRTLKIMSTQIKSLLEESI